MSPVKELLDRFFAKAGQLDRQGQRDVWALLTALRGPDIETSGVKDYTTARIRARVCPGFAIEQGAIVAGLSPMVEDGQVRTIYGRSGIDRSDIDRVGWHFINHTEDAHEALVRNGYYEELAP